MSPSLVILFLCCFVSSQDATKETTPEVTVEPQAVTEADNTTAVGIVDPNVKVSSGNAGGLFAAFTSSFLMILTSEIGDKTFFIAAIMSMTHNRVTVFSGAICALAVMTILSAAMGWTIPNLLPHSVTHSVSIVLFLFFGVKLLKEVYEHDPKATKNEELEEVEQELEAKEAKKSDIELGVPEKPVPTSKFALTRYFSPIFLTAFTMTFFAEWGDRSQITTIALASVKDAIGVTLGGIIGHAVCTGMAVIGGKLLASRISERMVALVGGILFLIFALHSFLYPEL